MNNILMDQLIGPELAAPWLTRRCQLPGPVRNLFGAELPRGRLFLRWQKPRGSSPPPGYQIERTREGRVYELLAKTEQLQIILSAPPLHEPWFYRVSAENERGIGRAKWVCFFMRRNRLDGGSILQLVATGGGIKINICEIVPQQRQKTLRDRDMRNGRAENIIPQISA